MKLQSEGLGFARLMMVLSSISPLFLLWAMKGTSLIPDYYFIPICALMILVPNAILYWRIKCATQKKQPREIVVGAAEDQRSHLLVYLFAMLLPLYAVELSSWREMATTLTALAFIVFLFWHLNLHYMNLLFAFKGYRVFSFTTNRDGSPASGKQVKVLITKRQALHEEDRINAYRISDTVLFEPGEES